MRFSVADVKVWCDAVTCVPTALAAISGKTPTEIGIILQSAAQHFDVDIPSTLRADYDINHWLKAITLMRGDWKPVMNYDDEVFERRPTINKWMSDHAHAGLTLVFSDDGGESSHVFAALNGDIVDCYTNGKRIKFNEVPDEYRAFRVKRTFPISELGSQVP